MIEEMMNMGGEPEMDQGADPALKQAIIEVLMQLLTEAESASGELISNDLEGMKEVTVASDTEEGLEEGLDVAEQVVGDEDEDEDEDTMY